MSATKIFFGLIAFIISGMLSLFSITVTFTLALWFMIIPGVLFGILAIKSVIWGFGVKNGK